MDRPWRKAMYRITKQGKHGQDGGGVLDIPWAWFVDGVAYIDDREHAERYRMRGYGVELVNPSQVPHDYRVAAARMLRAWADKGIVIR
jgi:hypothetical protein